MIRSRGSRSSSFFRDVAFAFDLIGQRALCGGDVRQPGRIVTFLDRLSGSEWVGRRRVPTKLRRVRDRGGLARAEGDNIDLDDVIARLRRAGFVVAGSRRGPIREAFDGRRDGLRHARGLGAALLRQARERGFGAGRRVRGGGGGDELGAVVSGGAPREGNSDLLLVRRVADEDGRGGGGERVGRRQVVLWAARHGTGRDGGEGCGGLGVDLEGLLRQEAWLLAVRGLADVRVRAELGARGAGVVRGARARALGLGLGAVRRSDGDVEGERDGEAVAEQVGLEGGAEVGVRGVAREQVAHVGVRKRRRVRVRLGAREQAVEEGGRGLEGGVRRPPRGRGHREDLCGRDGGTGGDGEGEGGWEGRHETKMCVVGDEGGGNWCTWLLDERALRGLGGSYRAARAVGEGRLA